MEHPWKVNPWLMKCCFEQKHRSQKSKRELAAADQKNEQLSSLGSNSGYRKRCLLFDSSAFQKQNLVLVVVVVADVAGDDAVGRWQKRCMDQKMMLQVGGQHMLKNRFRMRLQGRSIIGSPLL